MPKLKEDDWDKIVHNISIISFLQGLNIGSKVYNGYSIITNTKNKEVVTTDSIYIVYNNEYYRATDETLKDKTNLSGKLLIDFERKSKENEDGSMMYYYSNRETMSYSNLLNSSEIDTDDIVKYMASIDNKELASAYYTALGRERYSMYKTNRDTDELKKKLKN